MTTHFNHCSQTVKILFICIKTHWGCLELDSVESELPQRRGGGRGRGWEVSSRRGDMPQKLFVDCILSTPFSHDLHIGHLKTASRLLGT